MEGAVESIVATMLKFDPANCSTSGPCSVTSTPVTVYLTGPARRPDAQMKKAANTIQIPVPARSRNVTLLRIIEEKLHVDRSPMLLIFPRVGIFGFNSRQLTALLKVRMASVRLILPGHNQESTRVS